MPPLSFAAFVSAFLLVVGSASAQVPPTGAPLPGERDLIRDRQERLLEQQRQRLEELQQLPGRDAAETEVIPDDQRCFDIRSISLKGATLISAQQQATAIVDRTGQRYLAGLTSDEAIYRYLMDNAIASKAALNLSLGVSLTAEQVAALTHDIVWMEEHEVMGEKVLVPVLYLAQAEGRLAANGALIQGQDVALISGSDLTNRGTLRASQNLDVTAGNVLNIGGSMETSERLQLLATGSIRNAQGGVIAGRDVSAIALTGDIINERTVIRDEVRYGSRHSITDYVSDAPPPSRRPATSRSRPAVT